MMYKVLNSDQLLELFANLKDGLPGTAKIFYTVRHMLKGLLPNFECLVDKWPNWTCIVLRPEANKEVPQFFENSYICHTNSASSLKYFLQRPGVIDWTKSANFSGIPYDLIAVTKEFARKLGGKFECREPHIMYAWCEAVSLDMSSHIPEGFSLDTLKKSDVPLVFKHWKSSLSEHKGIYDYFETIITNFENSCLRDNATSEVVAYTCRKFNGSISMIYVQPKHRRKGFCHIVFADIMQKIIDNGDIPFGFLATNSKELIETARKHHFTWVPQSNMTWATYEMTHPF